MAAAADWSAMSLPLNRPLHPLGLGTIWTRSVVMKFEWPYIVPHLARLGCMMPQLRASTGNVIILALPLYYTLE